MPSRQTRSRLVHHGSGPWPRHGGRSRRFLLGPARDPESASVWRRSVGESSQFRELARELGALGDGVHGAYLNGWRNASAALTWGTPNTVSLAVRASSTTIWVCPVSRSHRSETVKPSEWRVSSSTNTMKDLSGVSLWRRLWVN